MFVRPAKKEDFEGLTFEIRGYLPFPEEVKAKVEQEGVTIAAQLLREQTGMGVKEAIGCCETYHKYVCAKRDFENGKPVFVPY